MSNRTLKEYGRTTPKVRAPLVEGVLPAYFQDSYPNLITFMKKYYDYTLYESSNILTYSLYNQLFTLRDLDETTLSYIDRILYEVASNISTSDLDKPVLYSKFIPFLIKNKGNEFGSDLFFKMLLGEENAEVQYPKNKIFTLNKSKLTEGDVLQDGAKYQRLSILIKTSIPINEWETLYKKLVHPAGFFLSADVEIETLSLNDLTSLSSYEFNIGDELVEISVVGTSDPQSSAINEIYAQYDSDGTTLRTNVVPIGDYSEVTIETINTQYDNLYEFSKMASETFDQDSDGTSNVVDMSNTIETFDEGFDDIS